MALHGSIGLSLRYLDLHQKSQYYPQKKHKNYSEQK